MSKIQITLDAAKLRNLISTRSYTNREGQEVNIQEVKFDLIEMKPESHKVVYEHAKFDLVKTHFAVEQQTKEQREAKADPNYIGEGITQVWKESNDTPAPNIPTAHEASQGAMEDDLPF